jgi:hypothetical protein
MVIYSLGVQLDTGVIYRYDGSAWKAWDSGWIDYNATLTLTGFSVGTGGSALKSGFYRYVNGVVEVKVRFIFGSSGGVITSAPPIFSLPVNSLSPHIIWAYDGEAQFYDLSSTTTTFGGIVSPATNSVSSVAFVTKFAPSTGASSVISPAYVTATVPFTLGAGDYFEARFRYDPA